MTYRRWAILPLSLALVFGSLQTSNAVSAAEFPGRSVKLIVPGAAGSDADAVSRLIADKLATVWKQAVVIENRPGGAGLIATQAAASAAADGHTLYFAQASTFTIVPFVGPPISLDPAQALVPIAFVASIPFGLAVDAVRGKRSLKELIESAKDNPDKLQVGTGFRGGLNNLASELLANRAGISLHIVPYNASSLPDLLGGRLDMSITGVAALAGQVAAGRLRLIAVTSDRRLPHFPDVPAAREIVPDFEAVGWFALFAPVNTPAAAVKRIHEDVKATLEEPALVARLNELGAFPRYMTMDELTTFIRKERELWGPLAKQAEAKANEPAR